MISGLRFNIADTSVRLFAQEVQPNGSNVDEQRPAILLLHGSGGHVEFWADRLGALLSEARIGLYAPHYFDRTGTIRADLAMITDGIHVPRWIETIEAALAAVAERPSVDPRQIVLAGVSLGGFLGLALAATLSAKTDPWQWTRLKALIDVSGGLVSPYDGIATVHMPPTLILHGASDTIVPVHFANDLDHRLQQLGVAHRTEILAGEGHWFSAAALPRMLCAVSSFLEQHFAV